MISTRGSILFIFALLELSMSSLHARVIELDSINDYIKQGNQLVEGKWFKSESEEQLRGHLARSFMPDFSVDFGHESYREGSASRFSENFWMLRTNVNLYNRGRDVIAEKLIHSRVNQANLNYEQVIAFESFRAQKKYFKLMDLEMRKEYLLMYQQEVKDLIEKSRGRVRNRSMLESDLVRIQVQLSHIEHEFSQVQLEIDEVKNSLSVLLNFDDHKSLKTEGKFPAKNDHHEIIKGRLKLSAQLDLKHMNYFVEQTVLEKDRADRWWRPKVDIYGSYGRPSGTGEAILARLREEEVAVGINIHFDIGASLGQRAISNSKYYSLLYFESMKNYREKELLSTDHELRHDLKRLYEMIKSTENELKYSNRYLELVSIEFSRGVKEASDLLEALSLRVQSQKKISELNATYFSKRAELMFLNY